MNFEKPDGNIAIALLTVGKGKLGYALFWCIVLCFVTILFLVFFFTHWFTLVAMPKEQALKIFTVSIIGLMMFPIVDLFVDFD